MFLRSSFVRCDENSLRFLQTKEAIKNFFEESHINCAEKITCQKGRLKRIPIFGYNRTGRSKRRTSPLVGLSNAVLFVSVFVFKDSLGEA